MSSRDAVIDAVLWAMCALSLAGVVWGSLGTPPEAVFSFPHADKVLHASSYFTLSGLFLLAAVWRPGRGPGRFPTSGRVAVAGVVALGAVLEIAQGLLLQRQSELIDALANVAGASVGAAAWRALLLRQP